MGRAELAGRVSYRPELIVSGGQTGADQGGLRAAVELDIPTGGYAAKGWMTELGPSPELRAYGLVECEEDGYPARTRLNVFSSDGTAIFREKFSPSTSLTIKECLRVRRPHIINPSADQLRDWCEYNRILILNVAGTRESKCVGMEKRVYGVVVEAFGG